MMAFPEPGSTTDLRGLLLDYLDFYRSVIAAKINGLSAQQLQQSQMPTGWTPAGMVNHLVHMERRWLQWGFAGAAVDGPWADSDGSGWHNLDLDAAGLGGMLDEVASKTRHIVESHDLTETAQVGGRFASPEEAPQLQWILLHVLQEYARHAGHLDIARELIDGRVGEQ